MWRCTGRAYKHYDNKKVIKISNHEIRKRILILQLIYSHLCYRRNLNLVIKYASSFLEQNNSC